MDVIWCHRRRLTERFLTRSWKLPYLIVFPHSEAVNFKLILRIGYIIQISSWIYNGQSNYRTVDLMKVNEVYNIQDYSSKTQNLWKERVKMGQNVPSEFHLTGEIPFFDYGERLVRIERNVDDRRWRRPRNCRHFGRRYRAYNFFWDRVISSNIHSGISVYFIWFLQFLLQFRCRFASSLNRCTYYTAVIIIFTQLYRGEEK